MPVVETPSRVHRMVRGGTYLAEAGAALGIAGVVVADGATSALRADSGALVGLVAWGVGWTTTLGGSPLRRAVGYRVVGRDGGRPPLLGSALREVLRLLWGCAVLATAGFVGAVQTARADRRRDRVTSTSLVGRPDRFVVGATALAALVVASAGGLTAALGEWSTSGRAALWVATYALALAAAVLGVAQEEIRHLAAIGALGDVSEEVTDDDESVESVEDNHLPWRTVEVGWPVADPGADLDPDAPERWAPRRHPGPGPS